MGWVASRNSIRTVLLVQEAVFRKRDLVYLSYVVAYQEHDGDETELRNMPEVTNKE
jgi:hypothetical protein